jgi:hypothetical protein
LSTSELRRVTVESMSRKRIIVGAVAAAVVLAGGGLAAKYRMAMGKSGPSDTYGGSIEAKLVPELTTQDKGRWVNGEPTTLAAHRGSPVLIESWSPG